MPTTPTSKMTATARDEAACKKLDDELSAPIANLDLEEWLEFLNSDEVGANSENQQCASTDESPALKQSPRTRSSSRARTLVDSVDLCDSLEDLVKTFDKNVKECLANYTDIDVGQLAPVQVRTQADIMNDSQ